VYTYIIYIKTLVYQDARASGTLRGTRASPCETPPTPPARPAVFNSPCAVFADFCVRLRSAFRCVRVQLRSAFASRCVLLRSGNPAFSSVRVQLRSAFTAFVFSCVQGSCVQLRSAFAAFCVQLRSANLALGKVANAAVMLPMLPVPPCRQNPSKYVYAATVPRGPRQCRQYASTPRVLLQLCRQP